MQHNKDIKYIPNPITYVSGYSGKTITIDESELPKICAGIEFNSSQYSTSNGIKEINTRKYKDLK